MEIEAALTLGLDVIESLSATAPDVVEEELELQSSPSPKDSKLGQTLEIFNEEEV